jgi:hypothetical protein
VLKVAKPGLGIHYQSALDEPHLHLILIPAELFAFTLHLPVVHVGWGKRQKAALVATVIVQGEKNPGKKVLF